MRAASKRSASGGSRKVVPLAGEPIVDKLACAASNGSAIGGLKLATENGWFAERPPGTEEVSKIYVELFTSAEHLQQAVAEAKEIASAARGLE